MKKWNDIVLQLSVAALLNSSLIVPCFSTLTENKSDNIDTLKNEPIQGVFQPITMRHAVFAVDSIFISFHHIQPSFHFHSVRHYNEREHLPTDSPLKAFKFALGQYTSDY
ncbi:hypothetical protein JXA70_09755 [candidate division KSB1 bacterium]|nr:hypothetical protein [candidate division KSB1 bacterium]